MAPESLTQRTYSPKTDGNAIPPNFLTCSLELRSYTFRGLYYLIMITRF